MTQYLMETSIMERKPSPSAIRMRCLRARRKRGWTRVIPVEVSAMDAVALREAGFLRPGESALDDLPKALTRLVGSNQWRVTR